jgi:hypothetical protein
VGETTGVQPETRYARSGDVSIAYQYLQARLDDIPKRKCRLHALAVARRGWREISVRTASCSSTPACPESVAGGAEGG